AWVKADPGGGNGGGGENERFEADGAAGQPCRILAPRQEEDEGSDRGLREERPGSSRFLERPRQPGRSPRRRRTEGACGRKLRKVAGSQSLEPFGGRGTPEAEGEAGQLRLTRGSRADRARG